jgi:hypothetical protein
MSAPLIAVAGVAERNRDRGWRHDGRFRSSKREPGMLPWVTLPGSTHGPRSFEARDLDPADTCLSRAKVGEVVERHYAADQPVGDLGSGGQRPAIGS